MIESVEQEVRRYGKENIMFSIVCPMFVNTNMLQEKEDRILISSRCSKAIYCLCHYYLNNDVHCMFFWTIIGPYTKSYSLYTDIIDSLFVLYISSSEDVIS